MITANRNRFGSTHFIGIIHTFSCLALDPRIGTGIAAHGLIRHAYNFLLERIATGTLCIHSIDTRYGDTVTGTKMIAVGCTVGYITIELIQNKNILSLKSSLLVSPERMFFKHYFDCNVIVTISGVTRNRNGSFDIPIPLVTYKTASLPSPMVTSCRPST